MLDLDVCRHFLVIHLDEEDETPPSWIGDNGFLSCEHAPKSTTFYSLGNISCEDAASEWQKILQVIRNKIGASLREKALFVLAHDLQKSCNELVTFIDDNEYVQWHYDYSSRDFGYEDFWQDIRTADTCCQLVQRLEHWVQVFWNNSHITDPIGRIKHRAFHQVGPIVKDVEHLHELLEGHQWQEFVAHLERLRDEWQGTFPASQSLKSYLARVWYLMVGENFEWQKLGISPPNDVGLIPAAKGERCCLLEILQRTHKGPLDSIDEWQALVKLLQLSESGTGTFTLKSGAGVYRFACLMDYLVAEPELFDQQKLYSGFENNKLLTDELEAFQDWFRKVNKQLQLLRGKWRLTSLSSATSDSETS